jgi:hypothetical protein
MGKFPVDSLGICPHFDGMEQLIAEIETYARAARLTPQSVIRRAVNAKGSAWALWCSGQSSPTMATVDTLRAWMRDNPPAQAESVEAAE